MLDESSKLSKVSNNPFRTLIVSAFFITNKNSANAYSNPVRPQNPFSLEKQFSGTSHRIKLDSRKLFFENAHACAQSSTYIFVLKSFKYSLEVYSRALGVVAHGV